MPETHLRSLVYLLAAVFLSSGCSGNDPDTHDLRSVEPGTSEADATDVHAFDAGSGQQPDATPLPPVPEPGQAFELDCTNAAPTEELRAWLDDHEHCYGEGDPLFEDVTLEAGLAHMHKMPADLTLYKGMIGGGAVLEDLNNDGWLDLYLSNADGANRLFLNDGTGSFRDCTAAAQLEFEQDWTNGVSAADFNNDGWLDLYLANRGPDRLIRNNGDGTFTDVTQQAGIAAHGNSAGASWGDLDGDGFLELFVSTLAWDFAVDGTGIEKGSSHLFDNRGDGTFSDMSVRVGLVDGSTFITPMIDFDNDGDLDILVTQEFYEYTLPQFFRNDGLNADGQVRLTDIFNASDIPVTRATMGVGVFDYNRDGLVDLAMSNLSGMPPFREGLLENHGDLSFEDVAPDRDAWLLESTYTEDGPNRLVSWAMVAVDVENDGDDDLYISYGNFNPGTDLVRSAENYPPYAAGQPNALLLDDGDGHFGTRNGSCAEDTGRSRAALAGDVNADGCLDLVVINQDGAVRLLENRCETANNHLSVQLVGTTSNRDAVGARAAVTVNGRTHHRRVLSGSNSVHSTAPRRLHFGLGDATHAERVEIWWPAGAHQLFEQVPAGSITLEEPESSN
ncbi:MAG: CRTAC1 family protein [Persicimonas sp.]